MTLGIEHVILAVLLRDALSALVESFNRVLPRQLLSTSFHTDVGPPVSQSPLLIILRPRVIKRMGELMRGNCTKGAVIDVGRRFGIEERRLQDACWEDNFVIWRTEVRVYS